MAHCDKVWSLPSPKDLVWHAVQFIAYGSGWCTHGLQAQLTHWSSIPGENSGRPPIYPTEFVHEGVKEMPLRK